MNKFNFKKDKFIRRELWLLTYTSAFQHALIYTKLNKISDNTRKNFKEEMFEWCNEIVEKQYHAEVSEKKHIDNIHALINYTSDFFPDILDNRRIKFGIAQKILNLYLKYLWCIGDIPTPPHFPVDRIIQDILRLPQRFSWTKMDSEVEYMSIIKQAKKVQKERNYSNLAEMELNEYSRS